VQIGLSDHPSFDMTLREFLDFASRLHVKHVELKMDSPSFLSALHKVNKISAIKNTLTSYNFRLFLHAPTIDINLASLNPHIGRASEKLTLKALYFADKVDAELMVSHVGRLSKDYPQSFIDKSLKNAVVRLKRLVKASKDLEITFTIENDHRTADYVLAGYPEQVLSLIRKLDCKLTFDIGHANTLGEVESFFDMLSMDIVNIHLHDNNGINDEHLPLGKGKMNAAKILEKLRASGCSTVTLECHSIRGLQKDLNLLRKLRYQT